MNLLKFWEQVDQETGAVSKAELAGFVHDMARILPEAERTDFLCRLRNIRKKDALKAVKPDVEKGIIEKFNRIKTDLERIEKEELCLAGSLNQEYDEWYCSEEWFWKCFKRWKESVSISAEEQENCLQWIDGLITKRVDGIMYKNHRNYYGECAAYIAALGEVQESRGEIGGKQRTMARYKETYSRRSAFHGELRTYGMIDFRKKK